MDSFFIEKNIAKIQIWKDKNSNLEVVVFFIIGTIIIIFIIIISSSQREVLEVSHCDRSVSVVRRTWCLVNNLL